MEKFTLPQALVDRVVERCGRTHPFDTIEIEKTALIVIDMQNYYMAPGYFGEVAAARDIVPNVNSLASEVRRRGGTVFWIKNTSTGTQHNWSVYHDRILNAENATRRYQTLENTHSGFELWADLDVLEQDHIVVKTRFSPFVEGSSDLHETLQQVGIDTLLIAGTATNICCETAGRDAMMLNYKVILVSDALAAISFQEHERALCAFYGLFGDVQSLDEVTAVLSGASADQS